MSSVSIKVSHFFLSGFKRLLLSMNLNINILTQLKCRKLHSYGFINFLREVKQQIFYTVVKFIQQNFSNIIFLPCCGISDVTDPYLSKTNVILFYLGFKP